MNRSGFEACEDRRPNFVSRASMQFNPKGSSHIQSDRPEWVAGSDADRWKDAHDLLGWPLEGPLALDTLGKDGADFDASMDDPNRSPQLIKDVFWACMQVFLVEVSDDGADGVIAFWKDDGSLGCIIQL